MSFDNLQFMYQMGWMSADMLAEFVPTGVITQEQYDQITGANQATQSSATDSQSAAQSSVAASSEQPQSSESTQSNTAQ